MAREASTHPTELELEILKVLWDTGPAPVRAVRDALAERRALAYTSVMTVMNIMADKGYLRRTKSGNSYIYRPVLNREKTMNRMLGDLVDRLFEGSAASAAVQLLETSDLDDAELKALRALIRRKTREEKA